MPTTAPSKNTAITQKELQNTPASAPDAPQSAPMLDTHPVMLSIIIWYLPSIRRMKLPEMPGSIMAQIAMAPLRNMNQRASGVSVGERVQIATPRAMPSATYSPSRNFHPLIPRRMKMDDATISPKKKAQVCIGWVFSSICINPASDTTLIPMPAARATRKPPLICFQKSRNLPLRSIFTASPFTDAIDPTSLS